jgi:pilus assembly protein FimV
MKTVVRRVLLMSAIMSPSALYALGLGDIRLNSALNQPFDAEIELVSAAQEDLAALRASLASSDTFLRYGLDRPSYLADFTFRVVQSGGKDVLKITSPRPVTEPFVTLLVEANWPRGRLLREYTVLLDPPVFAPAAAVAEPAVATPRTTTASRPVSPARAEPEGEPAPAPAPREPRAARAVAAPSAEPGSTYRVRPNDTLWQIASSAYAGSRADVNRAMVAIYESNPAAFGGNINVLRAGSELRMPSSGEVSAISASTAADEVARQYRAWKEGATASAEAADGGRLRLVTPEQGSAAPSTATAAPAAGSSGDLQSRVQQLEAELAEARRLLEVRNAELATLQGGAAVAEPAAPTGAGAAEGAEAATPPAEGPEAAVQPQPEPEAAAQPEPEPEAKPAAPVEAEPGLLGRLGEYWWALLGLLVAALGIAVFLRKRRATTSAEEDLEEALGRRAADDLRSRMAAAAPRQREPSILVEERKPVEPSPAKASAVAAAAAVPRAPEPSRKPITIDDTLSGEGPVSIEAGDPLAEADFHMAYGLYDQAAELVQVAARREPKRRDLKLKLLEIFFVWGNRERFLEVAREMQASGGHAQPGEWDKVLIMGRQLAPEDPLFAGAAAASPDSLDMELGEGDAALDMDLQGAAPGTLPDVDLSADEPRVEGGEGGLDFMLDEPVRGVDDGSSTAPTIETPRVRAAGNDDPTTEVPIEDLGLDMGDVEGLDDTLERPGPGGDVDDDLLSSTSIMSGEVIAEMVDEAEPGVVDLSDATGELSYVKTQRLEVTGILKQPEFGLEGEATTMSEVGTKLDLARAYIDMGDPEGARSILDEVLKEGNPTQRKEAERLLAGLP